MSSESVPALPFTLASKQPKALGFQPHRLGERSDETPDFDSGIGAFNRRM